MSALVTQDYIKKKKNLYEPFNTISTLHCSGFLFILSSILASFLHRYRVQVLHSKAYCEDLNATQSDQRFQAAPSDQMQRGKRFSMEEVSASLSGPQLRICSNGSN